MIDVTITLTKYNKRISKFKKLKRVASLLESGEATIQTNKGRYDGYSKISENLYKEFMLWVSDETRKKVLDK